MDKTASSITGLSLPPDKFSDLRPPTETRNPTLPFADLSWENFERLCHRLASADAKVERAARYGKQGQSQEGIDIYARYPNQKYHCWQVKRHKTFNAANLAEAVDKFVSGEWAERTTKFTLAVQANLDDKKVQDEIELQNALLRKREIEFVALGGQELSDVLRLHPKLVDDFFGRNWVAALLGENIAATLSGRLDGRKISDLRTQLKKVYDQQFHLIDPGSFASPLEEESTAPLSLLERFLTPDVLIRQRQERPIGDLESVNETKNDETSSVGRSDDLIKPIGLEAPRNLKMEILTRRIVLGDWLAKGDRFIFSGEAGSGKSTFLRCLALDLLSNQKHFPEVSERWGGMIPLHIPFARWSREVKRDGSTVGLKEIVRRALQPLMTSELVGMIDQAIDERRVLLLIDGLDEWSDEQAARTALHQLLTFVGAHDVPAVLTARPRGLVRIGGVPNNWKSSEIAPLSTQQQRQLASRWFDRYSLADTAGQLASNFSELRCEKFMAELARDGSLTALGSVPLLLVGLITLSLRGQILPRNKVDALEQLVSLLLEQHPKARATASGDAHDRFEHAHDPEQRRAALCRLAFAVRSETGDAGYPKTAARKLLSEFLSSVDGFELAKTEALSVSKEILAVNSETQGLLIEKAPDEVGFTHASFEEFLSAEHITSWPFERARKFVATQAGNPRWRNVILNFLSCVRRRDEFDLLVKAIEDEKDDPLATKYRQGLLYEIAFTARNRSPKTTTTLVGQAYETIESGDWFPLRVDALKSAIGALNDPSLAGSVAERVDRWMPKRSDWNSPIFLSLGGWKPAPDLLEFLWRGLHDDDRRTQRAAATALAQAYGGNDDVGEKLAEHAKQNQRLSASAAMLEALRLGWPERDQYEELFRQAEQSLSATLKLVGIAYFTDRGEKPDNYLESLKEMIRDQSETHYVDREFANALIRNHWLNDDNLISSALKVAGRTYVRSDDWNHSDASLYLLSCSPDIEEIRPWIIEEFDEKYPFNVIGTRHIWELVGRFASASQSVANAAIRYWSDIKNREFSRLDLKYFVNAAPFDELRALLIEDLPTLKDFDKYWATLSLIEGWGIDDAKAGPVLKDIPNWLDDELFDLVSLLPSLMVDTSKCRNRLLELSKYVDVRRDLLAEGLVQCGSDGRDDEAVAAILRKSKKTGGIFSAKPQLFQYFSVHKEVRLLALADLENAEPSFGSLSLGFENDAEIRNRLLNSSSSLTTELRHLIAEAAIADPLSPQFAKILNSYDLEVDGDLKVKLAIGYYRTRINSDDDVERLMAGMQAVGPHYSVRRAAAFAGLLTIGQLERLRNETDVSGPLRLVIGDSLSPMPSLDEAICEHWDELNDVLGPTLSERVEHHRTENDLNQALILACGRSSGAKDEFQRRFEQGEIPKNHQSLKAYAELRPGNEYLLTSCWEVIERSNGSYNDLFGNAEIAKLMLANFPNNPEIASRFLELFKKKRYTDKLLPLAVYSPKSLTEIKFTKTPFEIGCEFGDWVSAVLVSAAIDSAADLASVFDAMLRRSSHSFRGLQKISNSAILDRLQTDKLFEDELKRRLKKPEDPQLMVNASRYLGGAGKLDAANRDLIISAIEDAMCRNIIPCAVYDAMTGRVRSFSTCLLYSLHGEVDS